MCYNSTVNNRLYERCLRIVYSNKKSCFKEPLETDKSVPIHIKNLETLAIEVTVGTSLVSSENHFESYIKKKNLHTYLDKLGKRCKSINKSTQAQFHDI